MRNHHHLAGLAGGVDHSLAVGNGAGHRFLDQHVLARLENIDRVLAMKQRGRGYDDGVDIGIGKHLPVIGIERGERMRFAELGPRRLRPIRAGGDATIAKLRKRLGLLKAHATGSEESDVKHGFVRFVAKN